MNHKLHTVLSVFVLVSIVSLTACGGGGGGGNSATTPDPVPDTNDAPTVDAGADQTVASESVVTLSATVTDDGTPTISWTQTSGDAVTLADPASATTSFTAPVVTEATTLAFEVTVDDGVNAAVSDTVSIVVDPELVEVAESLDPDDFVASGLVSNITTEACTLSGGTQTTCYRIEVTGAPAAEDYGPFCPPSIDSSAEEGGLWFDGSGMIYDIDGDFILDLPNIYGDANWQLYDPATGLVNVTDTQESCEAAARPNVAEEYQNFCVACDIEYYGGGVSTTFLIPIEPVPLAGTGNLNNSDLGLALNGVVLAPPAPVNAILGAYTIAAFDDCGGHVNPVAGYHYHGATGCTDLINQDDGHAPKLGYIKDGYAIYAMLNEDGTEPDDLDECRGHTDEVRGYHYHSASAGENMFIGCYRGEQGSVQ